MIKQITNSSHIDRKISSSYALLFISLLIMDVIYKLIFFVQRQFIKGINHEVMISGYILAVSIGIYLPYYSREKTFRRALVLYPINIHLVSAIKFAKILAGSIVYYAYFYYSTMFIFGVGNYHVVPFLLNGVIITGVSVLFGVIFYKLELKKLAFSSYFTLTIVYIILTFYFTYLYKFSKTPIAFTIFGLVVLCYIAVRRMKHLLINSKELPNY